MRILHIISRMDPAGGGPQEVVRLLLRYAPQDYTQEIVTLDDPAAAFLQDETATVHALGPGKRLAAPHLTRWLRANRDRFDGIILHGMWEYASFAALRSIAGHTHYVVFAHGMLDPYFKRASPLKHLKKWFYWLPVQYWTLRRAHRVLFTTAAERDLATQSFWLHRWKPMVVALGAASPPQDLAACAGAFYERCPAVLGKRFLLFLGRIDPKKGCDILIDAFSQTLEHLSSGHAKKNVISTDQRERRDPCILSASPINQASEEDPLARFRDPDLHLVIAGPDPDNWGERLRANAQTWGYADRIHWPGMLTGNAKWGALAACEAFILPSHQENFGIAVVEALACGKPALITKQVNIAADLEADGCALVDDDTLVGTERLIGHWLQLTQEQRTNMGTRARNTFATRYDMRMNARAILRCFEESC